MQDDFDSWLAGRHEVADSGELPTGTAIGDYRIVALLGRGGFAEVYRAEDGQGRAVAIKILHRLDERSRSRFAREYAILAQSRHPNIPRLLDRGQFGERPYLVTELLQGGELPRGDRRVAAFLRQLISAVDELHRKGYVHRDIKPANILFREDGTPVLIDYGLASPISAVQWEKDALSMDGGSPVAVGTVGYSAPEQFSGQGAGPEADVHAVGSLIDACFGGKLSPCWRTIHLAATASNPRSRYQSMAALEQAIRRRHWDWMPVLVSAVVVGLLVGGLMVGLRKPVPVEASMMGAPNYSYKTEWWPNDDQPSANAVSEVEVRLWYWVRGVGADRHDELKDFLNDCMQTFLSEEFQVKRGDALEECNSAEIRQLCGNRRALMDALKVRLRDALEERNTDDDRWDIDLRDFVIELR